MCGYPKRQLEQNNEACKQHRLINVNPFVTSVFFFLASWRLAFCTAMVKKCMQMDELIIIDDWLGRAHVDNVEMRGIYNRILGPWRYSVGFTGAAQPNVAQLLDKSGHLLPMYLYYC